MFGIRAALRDWRERRETNALYRARRDQILALSLAEAQAQFRLALNQQNCRIVTVENRRALDDWKDFLAPNLFAIVNAYERLQVGEVTLAVGSAFMRRISEETVLLGEAFDGDAEVFCKPFQEEVYVDEAGTVELTNPEALPSIFHLVLIALLSDEVFPKGRYAR